MRFPRNLGGIDQRKTGELVARAVEGGINYFDTAYIYPGSEEALGLALEREGLRDKVYIATKIPLMTLRGRDDFDRHLNRSLERLKTDRIDYYLFHMLSDMDTWERLGAWGAEKWVEEKKRQGKIGRIGFSFHGSRGEFFRLLEAYDWEFCQIQYNYSDENFQAGKAGLMKAAEKMAVMVMEPLLGGKLCSLPRRGAALFKKADPRKSAAEWGLNWVWDHREVTLLLSGMGDRAQLEENLVLAGKSRPGMLGEGERALYREVNGILNSVYRIRCTGCNYCMPCPRHINIPSCFSTYNLSYAMGWYHGVKNYITSIAVMSKQLGSPRFCAACGACESRCPQKLPIIPLLRQVRRRLEPPWITLTVAVVRAVLGVGGKNAPVPPANS
jgi:predicted aldo/keto reductase-like oxidoreductase